MPRRDVASGVGGLLECVHSEAGDVRELGAHLAGLALPSSDAADAWGRLAFPSATGTPMRAENLRRRVLEPAMAEAGASWAGFHALRHTFASMHIERGTNVLRLSRLLGHHSPAFTLNVYGHLLDDGLGDPLDLTGELLLVSVPDAPPSASGVSAAPQGIDVTPGPDSGAESADLQH